MPIDFNRQMIFDPKIDIIGKEVPLAEMEKTGNVLQGRYDQSYENYNKFQELAKQAEQIADPAEREKVKNWVSSLQPEVENIAQNGAFHNMRFQTMSLANNAANNLKMFGTRAETISKIKDQIAKAENVKDPAARKYYQDLLNDEVAKTTYDPDKKSFNFQSIDMPNVVGDTDFPKLFFGLGSQWKPSEHGYTNGDVKVLQDPIRDPKTGAILKAAGVYDVKTGSKVSEVKAEEILNGLKKTIAGTPGALATIERDTDIAMRNGNIPPEKRKEVYDKIYNEKVLGAMGAAADAYSYKSTETMADVNYADKGTQEGFGFGVQADNRGITDVYESTVNPGQVSPLIEELDSRDVMAPRSFTETLKHSGDNVYGGTTFEMKPEFQNKAKLIFSGLSPNALADMKKSDDPKKKALYEELNKNNVYDVYNSIMSGKPIGLARYSTIMNILKNNNYVPSTAYQYLSTADSRVKALLKDYFPQAITPNGVDPVKAQEGMNYIVFGSTQGLAKNANGEGVTGNVEGWSMLDPTTGKVITLKQALDDGTIDPATQPLQVNGKILPGSVIFGNSQDPQGNTSYFGNGWTVNYGSKQYIIGKRNDSNTNNAILNDLASFSRMPRTSYTYPTSKGDAVVKSNGDQVMVTLNGKTKSYKNKVFGQLLQNSSDKNQSALSVLTN